MAEKPIGHCCGNCENVILYGDTVMKRFFLMLLATAVFLSGCSSGWKYNPITDVNNLEGRRVGVNLGWESDYALSGRDDMTLYRYDSTAEMILALNYDKIDAFATDELYWRYAKKYSEGLEAVEPGYLQTGYLVYFGPDNRELKNEFNAYLAEFKKTEEYADYIAREAAYDGEEYNLPDNLPEPSTTGRVLKVAYDAESFPRSYQDLETGEAMGFDLEAVMRFGAARNYQIEFIPTSWTDMILGLQSGIYDMGDGYLSDVFFQEALELGLYPSDTMDTATIYFIQKNQPRIKLMGEM